jgi:hypothetical protein
MHPLLDLAGLTPEAKARRISAHYPALHDHPSGIFYSLLKIDGDRIRPFGPADFAGVETFSFKGWRFPPEGPWEYRNNENSIFTSGLWLVAQVERFLATGEAAAQAEAARAYASLEAIYRLGEADGKPGWMGKPYGFRLSDQTSGDQYLGAMWGLWCYLPIAPAAHAARAREMLVQFARYWRSVDYQIFYLDRVWDQRKEVHSYNAIYTAMNLIAHHLSGDESYRAEALKLFARGRWLTETKLDAWRRERRAGDASDWEPNRLAAGVLQPGEFLCWETTIHAAFTAISATLVHTLAPELVDHAALTGCLRRWWETWPLGIGDDLLPHYFFIVNLETGAWRPAPRTPRLPRDQWFLSQPHLSHINQKRWTEPLARFLFASVLAAGHDPDLAPAARALAERIFTRIDATAMCWQVDPDGKQIDPDLSDVRNVLSSEMPATFVATFWRGRRLGWW